MTPRLGMLRANRRFTNYTSIKLPIVTKTHKFGEQFFGVDFFRLSEFLTLPETVIERLKPVFEIPDKPRIKKIKERLNYEELAQQYQLLLTNGTCATMADIARRYGVSRVWIHTVMKHLPESAKTR